MGSHLDKDFLKKLEHIGIPTNMLNRAIIGEKEIWQPLIQLLDQRKVPELAWSDRQIRNLVNFLCELDTDKDPNAIRIGEREARLSTSLLEEYSGGFNHGVGRSGDLLAPQPKAVGASLMQNLTNHLVLSLMKSLGLNNLKAALTVPMGTGMALGMAFRGTANALKVNLREKFQVLMPQIDHKSPLKGLEYIGCEVISIPGEFGTNYFAPEGVFVPIQKVQEYYEKNKEKIAGIVSTTTFFAPRVPDDIKAIAKLAKEKNLIHIINNAYGIQSADMVKILTSAIDAGRVDAIVQSTDKNFLTPIGGAVITSPSEDIINGISQSYAGRASATPIVELFVSLLRMGVKGYEDYRYQQVGSRSELEIQLKKLCAEVNENYINCKNPISCAMTLSTFSSAQIEKLGGILYNLRVTGPRIVNSSKNSFGTCTNLKIPPYIVMNAAIGTEKAEIIESVNRLRSALEQVQKKE